MAGLECGPRIVDGWLGAVFRGTYNGKPVRLVPLAAVSTDLVEDLENRAKYSKRSKASRLLHGHGMDQSFVEAYWIFDIVEGYPLEHLCQRGFQPPVSVICTILSSLLSTLKQSYNKGIVHGDLHPNMIVLSKDGSVWLDGMGRLETKDIHPRTGEIRYFPPEDGSTLLGDVYSLGVIALEIFLGRRFPLEGRMPQSHQIMLSSLLSEVPQEASAFKEFLFYSLHLEPKQREKALNIPLQESVHELQRWCTEIFPKVENLYFSARSDLMFQATDPMDAIFDLDEFDDLEATHDFTDEITSINIEDELTDMIDVSQQSNFEKETKAGAKLKPLLMFAAVLVAALSVALLLW